MSEIDKPFPKISTPVRRYLEGELRAEELIRVVDEFVANDFLHGLDARFVALVERLHESLALYVRDEPTRKQEPGIYIGDVELRQRSTEFLDAVRLLEDR
jgi:hypothetical protein